jgi:cytoskeletal protein RodZ
MATHSAHTSSLESDCDGLGALLRNARIGLGLTLEQISKETKIPRRHLEALEHGNVAEVPGEFYRRAEIRTYARAVRLDQNIALAELERVVGPPVASGKIGKRSLPQEPKRFRRRVLIAIAVIGAAALFGRPVREQEIAVDNRVQIPQRTLLGRVTPPSPPGGVPAMTIAPTVPVSPAPNDESAVTTDTSEAPVSADSVTELVVTTDPAGARVTVNGIGWGTTPVTIRFLPAGQKRIRVTKEGYASEERMMRLIDGQPGMVDILLHTLPEAGGPPGPLR